MKLHSFYRVGVIGCDDDGEMGKVIVVQKSVLQLLDVGGSYAGSSTLQSGLKGTFGMQNCFVVPLGIVKAADRCEGFSARELSKLALAWRAAAFATRERVLTPSLVEETLNLQLGQHAVRVSWLERSIKRKRERDAALRAAAPRRPAKA